jgi:endosialidase-like protein
MNRAPGSRGTQTFQGWQILATGQTAPQGGDKLNIARQSGSVSLISSKDVFTITSDGKVGIGTTSPGSMLEIDAPNQAALHVTGPNAGFVGAGMSLSAVDPATAPGSNWEILATGSGAAQGPGRLNIRNLRTGEDIFTIQTDALGVAADAIGIGTTTPTQKLEVNGNVLANLFLVPSSREIKENILSLCSQEALEALEHLSPVKFNYKAEDPKKVHIGFVAEDVPELAATSNRRGVSIMDLVAILTQAVKEQQKTIKTLVEKTHKLESAVNGRAR